METTTDTDYLIETGTLLKILSLIYQQSYGNDMKIDEDGMSSSATIYGSDMPSVKHFLLDNKLIEQVKKGRIGTFTWIGAEPSQEMADQFQTYLSTPKKGKNVPEKGESAEGEPFSALEQDVSKIEKKELSSEEIIPQEEFKSDSSYLELCRVVTAALANMSDAVKRSTDMQKEMVEAQQKRPKKFKLVLLWGFIRYEKSE